MKTVEAYETTSGKLCKTRGEAARIEASDARTAILKWFEDYGPTRDSVLVLTLEEAAADIDEVALRELGNLVARAQAADGLSDSPICVR